MSPTSLESQWMPSAPYLGCLNFCHSACQLLLANLLSTTHSAALWLAVAPKPFFTSVINLTISSPFKRFPNAQINLYFNMANDLLGSWGKSRILNSKSSGFCLLSTRTSGSSKLIIWVGFFIWKLLSPYSMQCPFQYTGVIDCSSLGE